ncbi:MAG TPA: hypothetical protein VEU62_17380 [Bryobacterales bacterium]|nr:hypothetical protein [Bryobacterales bacterium]
MNKVNRNAKAARPEAGGIRCYCLGSGPRLTALTANMFQGPVFDHFRAAGLEVLLGLRAVLDAEIEVMTKRAKKGTRIPVE